MTTSRYGDFALYRRLARQARSSWPYIAMLFLVGLLASPLALLAPLPLKIAVDSVLGSRPLPRFLDALVPTAVTRAPTVLLGLVHGDFSGKNMRLRSSNRNSTVVVFDWEDAAWGVPALDLAQLAVPSSKLSANPDIHTYWSTVRERWPEASPEAWRRLADCGTVLRTLSALSWDAQNLAHDWAHAYVGGMHVYAAEFDHALERLEWNQ